MINRKLNMHPTTKSLRWPFLLVRIFSFSIHGWLIFFLDPITSCLPFRWENDFFQEKIRTTVPWLRIGALEKYWPQSWVSIPSVNVTRRAPRFFPHMTQAPLSPLPQFQKRTPNNIQRLTPTSFLINKINPSVGSTTNMPKNFVSLTLVILTFTSEKKIRSVKSLLPNKRLFFTACFDCLNHIYCILNGRRECSTSPFGIAVDLLAYVRQLITYIDMPARANGKAFFLIHCSLNIVTKFFQIRRYTHTYRITSNKKKKKNSIN